MSDMPMPQPEPSTPGQEDPLWSQFDAVSAEKDDQLEKDYKQIAHYNNILLNRVAGLEDSVFTIPSEDGQSTSELRGSSQDVLLYLRPDRKKQLYEANEHHRIHPEGDPYTITGPVPERTTKMLDEMLKGIEAKQDEEHSTPSQEVYMGNIGGQLIKVIFYHQTHTISDGKSQKEEPVFFARAYRVTEE